MQRKFDFNCFENKKPIRQSYQMLDVEYMKYGYNFVSMVYTLTSVYKWLC